MTTNNDEENDIKEIVDSIKTNTKPTFVPDSKNIKSLLDYGFLHDTSARSVLHADIKWIVRIYKFYEDHRQQNNQWNDESSNDSAVCSSMVSYSKLIQQIFDESIEPIIRQINGLIVHRISVDGSVKRRQSPSNNVLDSLQKLCGKPIVLPVSIYDVPKVLLDAVSTTSSNRKCTDYQIMLSYDAFYSYLITHVACTMVSSKIRNPDAFMSVGGVDVEILVGDDHHHNLCGLCPAGFLFCMNCKENFNNGRNGPIESLRIHTKKDCWREKQSIDVKKIIANGKRLIEIFGTTVGKLATKDEQFEVIIQMLREVQGEKAKCEAITEYYNEKRYKAIDELLDKKYGEKTTKNAITKVAYERDKEKQRRAVADLVQQGGDKEKMLLDIYELLRKYNIDEKKRKSRVDEFRIFTPKWSYNKLSGKTTVYLFSDLLFSEKENYCCNEFLAGVEMVATAYGTFLSLPSNDEIDEYDYENDETTVQWDTGDNLQAMDSNDGVTATDNMVNDPSYMSPSDTSQRQQQHQLSDSSIPNNNDYLSRHHLPVTIIRFVQFLMISFCIVYYYSTKQIRNDSISSTMRHLDANEVLHLTMTHDNYANQLNYVKKNNPFHQQIFSTSFSNKEDANNDSKNQKKKIELVCDRSWYTSLLDLPSIDLFAKTTDTGHDDTTSTSSTESSCESTSNEIDTSTGSSILRTCIEAVVQQLPNNTYEIVQNIVKWSTSTKEAVQQWIQKQMIELVRDRSWIVCTSSFNFSTKTTEKSEDDTSSGTTTESSCEQSNGDSESCMLLQLDSSEAPSWMKTHASDPNQLNYVQKSNPFHTRKYSTNIDEEDNDNSKNQKKKVNLVCDRSLNTSLLDLSSIDFFTTTTNMGDADTTSTSTITTESSSTMTRDSLSQLYYDKKNPLHQRKFSNSIDEEDKDNSKNRKKKVNMVCDRSLNTSLLDLSSFNFFRTTTNMGDDDTKSTTTTTTESESESSSTMTRDSLSQFYYVKKSNPFHQGQFRTSVDQEESDNSKMVELACDPSWTTPLLDLCSIDFFTLTTDTGDDDTTSTTANESSSDSGGSIRIATTTGSLAAIRLLQNDGYARVQYIVEGDTSTKKRVQQWIQQQLYNPPHFQLHQHPTSTTSDNGSSTPFQQRMISTSIDEDGNDDSKNQRTPLLDLCSIDFFTYTTDIGDDDTTSTTANDSSSDSSGSFKMHTTTESPTARTYFEAAIRLLQKYGYARVQYIVEGGTSTKNRVKQWIHHHTYNPPKFQLHQHPATTPSDYGSSTRGTGDSLENSANNNMTNAIDSSDMTNLIDHASKLNGGIVLYSTPSYIDTLPIFHRIFQMLYYRFYGYGPIMAITPVNYSTKRLGGNSNSNKNGVGQCWSFVRNRPATLMIQLHQPIQVDSVSIEHPLLSTDTKKNSSIQTFHVYGHEGVDGIKNVNDIVVHGLWNEETTTSDVPMGWYYLGTFTYDSDQAIAGTNGLVEFSILEPGQDEEDDNCDDDVERELLPAFQIIKLQIDPIVVEADGTITDKHDWSCLYRFRIHGQPVNSM